MSEKNQKNEAWAQLFSEIERGYLDQKKFEYFCFNKKDRKAIISIMRNDQDQTKLENLTNYIETNKINSFNDLNKYVRSIDDNELTNKYGLNKKFLSFNFSNALVYLSPAIDDTEKFKPEQKDSLLLAVKNKDKIDFDFNEFKTEILSSLDCIDGSLDVKDIINEFNKKNIENIVTKKGNGHEVIDNINSIKEYAKSLPNDKKTRTNEIIENIYNEIGTCLNFLEINNEKALEAFKKIPDEKDDILSKKRHSFADFIINLLSPILPESWKRVETKSESLKGKLYQSFNDFLENLEKKPQNFINEIHKENRKIQLSFTSEEKREEEIEIEIESPNNIFQRNSMDNDNPREMTFVMNQ